MLMVLTDATETVSLKQIFFFVSRDELYHYVYFHEVHGLQTVMLAGN